MSGERIYLDHNASAPLHAAAREAIAAALALTGNASSVHAEGRRARGLIENARAQVAGLAGVSAAAVVFTSGGTEAANLALRPALFAGLVTGGRPLLLMGAGEHVCVREGHSFDGGDTCDVRLTGEGVLDLGALADAINRAQGRTCILALQAANNETGAVQPVAEASALVRAAGGFVICDSVQAAGRMDCRELAKHADVLIFSAHKIGGPQGAGALIACNGRINPAQGALLRGGGQERGARAGTENVAAIAGFGAAASVAANERESNMALYGEWRGTFETALLRAIPDAEIFSRNTQRLANTSAFGVPGLDAQTLLIGMDLEGFALSSGSACSSGKVKASHVLDAMGIAPNVSKGALRVSFGSANTAEHALKAAAAMERVVTRIRRASVRAA